MKKVRWGLLSTAKINQRLIPALRASRRGELVAVASRSQEKAQAYATEWSIPLAFGSYQSMLDSGKIDAVYIGLPNHLHAEWSIRALNAGLHVLCEKPLAISVDEVRSMMDASRRSGKVLAEAFMYRHHPQTKIAGEWVQSGKLGEIISLFGTFSFYLDDPENVRWVPEFGGGSLWDVGVYPVSFAQFLLGGPPIWVFGTQRMGKSGVDESFAGQMFYHQGRIGQISSSFRLPWHTHFEISGSEGHLILNQPFVKMDRERRMLFYPQKGQAIEIKVPKADLYLGEVEDIHDAILEKKPPLISLEESLAHIQTVQALYTSAKNNQIVYL